MANQSGVGRNTKLHFGGKRGKNPYIRWWFGALKLVVNELQGHRTKVLTL